MNEDLKWLAESVHEWRVIGAMDVYACVYRHHHNSQPELYWSCSVEDCHKTKQYTRSQWQAVRDEMAAQKEWNGDGFPPVNTECEVRYLGKYNNNWLRIKITAVTDNFVIGYIRDEWESCLDKSDPNIDFRPLRNEEDTVVEGMMESGAIAAFYGAGGGAINDAAFEALFRQMFHNGYRKRGLI